MRKLHQHLRAAREAAVAATLPQARPADMRPHADDLDAELDEAAKAVQDAMREALRPEDLAQFAVTGEDADFAAAVGARAPAAGGVVSVPAKAGAGEGADAGANPGTNPGIDGKKAGGAPAMYPRPSLTVDAAIVAADKAKILLIKRKNPPCQGQWALPGGFVDENEPLDRAAARELQEETSVDPSGVLLEQVGAFGDPGRDPRGWCVSVAYAALVPSTSLGVKAADDAADAEWHDVAAPPQPLAFDHKEIVRAAFQRLLSHPQAQSGRLAEALSKGIQALQGAWEPPKV
ncbi:hypothetical protein WJX81_002988 [Elliptochloris bilobata]|uniref:Nudix hydrolase domain-containing protein n=1 Tax=Elliptochloris bilobata TaxID=381761 RepID=A0AAW1QXD8_9CHLO